VGAEDTWAFTEALRNGPLPRDDPAVFDNGSIVSHIGSVPVYNLNAVAVKVEYCGIEVTIFRAASTRGPVRTTTGSQCSGIEIPDRGRAGCGECNVCSAGSYATQLSVAVCLVIICGTDPGVSWQRKKSES
jgi:hypothetical protein